MRSAPSLGLLVALLLITLMEAETLSIVVEVGRRRSRDAGADARAGTLSAVAAPSTP